MGEGEDWALLSVPVKAFMGGKQSRNSCCSSEDSSVPCEGTPFPWGNIKGSGVAICQDSADGS